MTRREWITAMGAVAVMPIRDAARPARCTILDQNGEPLPPDALVRFHICDLLLRPSPIEPTFAPGEVAFEPPDKAFRISVPLRVPGFGQVFLYADNRGAGYTRASLAKSGGLLLNYEFAVDRLTTVQHLAEDCRRLGVVVSAATEGRITEATGLLQKADGARRVRAACARVAMESLRESLWAGESLVYERANHRISRQAPRPGFLFGSNAFQFATGPDWYREYFTQLFNYAILPFYRGMVERRGAVSGTGDAEQRDSQVAERGHDLSAGASADTRTVFIKGPIADPVETVFNCPIVAAQGEETLGMGFFGFEAGDAVNGFGPGFLRDHLRGIALDGENLCGIGKVQISGQFRAGPDGADFQAAMAFIGGGVRGGNRFQIQIGDVLPKGRLIVFDDEQVISLLFCDHVRGGVLLSVPRIRRNEGAFQRQRVEELRQFGNLVGFLSHIDLADHDGFLVEDRAHQTGSPLARLVAAPQAFPIDGDRISGPQMLSGDPLADFRIQAVGIELLQDAADGRFRRRSAAFRSQPLQGIAAEFLRPFRNGTETPRSGQGRLNGDAHNGDHRMAHAARLAQIHDGGQQVYQAAFSFQGESVRIHHPHTSSARESFS